MTVALLILYATGFNFTFMVMLCHVYDRKDLRDAPLLPLTLATIEHCTVMATFWPLVWVVEILTPPKDEDE